MKNKAMNLARTLWRICCAAALVTVAVGCALPQRTEELLSQAGFKTVPANTSSRQTRLRALPADRITMVQRQGKEYFVFPDVSQNVLYVGEKSQLQNYQELRGEHNRVLQEESNKLAVDPMWDEWDDWQPWTGGWQ